MTFLKALLDYLHEAMTISKDQRIAAISQDWDYLLPNLSGGEWLYFAYGSNMNKQQMAHDAQLAHDFLDWQTCPNLNSSSTTVVLPLFGLVSENQLRACFGTFRKQLIGIGWTDMKVSHLAIITS